MLSDFLKKNITSQANYVEYGYGQVEPNHLSAQRTAQIYAQLPTAAGIDLLENGQFVKYDYANGEVNNETHHAGEGMGKGEWMLVFNEIKLYRDNQMDCEFAMKKGNYYSRVYSPVSGDTNFDAQSRFYGKNEGDPTWKAMVQTAGVEHGGPEVMDLNKEKVIAPADMYELHYNEEPFHIESQTSPAMMKNRDAMVPRVFKTNVGDIFTTNMVNFTKNGNAPKLGDLLNVDKRNGILTDEGTGTSVASGDTMRWQIVKIYTLPDHQKAVKVMRVA